jgi:hypothetical protein
MLSRSSEPLPGTSLCLLTGPSETLTGTRLCPSKRRATCCWSSTPRIETLDSRDTVNCAPSSTYHDHLNRVHKDERHKYFRINTGIALDREPLLDNVSKIPELENLAATFLRGYNFSSIT